MPIVHPRVASERIITVSGIPVTERVIGAIPKGARANPASPTGYTFGANPPGGIWEIDIGEVGETKEKFGFSIVKMVYWNSSNEPFSEDQEDEIKDAVNGSNRWYVVLSVRNGPYIGIYAAPESAKDKITADANYFVSTVQNIRKAGETIVRKTAEVAKTTIETAGEFGKTMANLGTVAMKALKITAILAGAGVVAWGGFQIYTATKASKKAIR